MSDLKGIRTTGNKIEILYSERESESVLKGDITSGDKHEKGGFDIYLYKYFNPGTNSTEDFVLAVTAGTKVSEDFWRSLSYFPIEKQ